MILERRTTAPSCFSSFSLSSAALRCHGIVQYERCVSVVSSACRGLHVVISGIIHRPPRRARTRCRVAPPSSWYSLAVLSSFLHVHIVSHALAISCIRILSSSCTYICLPPKMRRCCAGGMPSFSSTRSLMRETCGWRFVSRIVLVLVYDWGRDSDGDTENICLPDAGVVPCSQAQCRARSPCR